MFAECMCNSSIGEVLRFINLFEPHKIGKIQNFWPHPLPSQYCSGNESEIFIVMLDKSPYFKEQPTSAFKFTKCSGIVQYSVWIYKSEQRSDL